MSGGRIECGPIYIANTTSVRLVGLARRGTLISDATVSVTLRTDAGDAVADAVAMPAVEGRPGEYEGFLPDTLELADGQRYIVHVIAAKVGAGIGDWRPKRLAKYRGDA